MNGTAGTAPEPCAVVVGAGSREGIGGAAALRLAREGLPTYVVGRTAGKLDRLVRDIESAGGCAMALPADVTQSGEVDRLYAQIHADGLRPGIVVSNVGSNEPREFLKSSPEFVEKLWRQACLSGFLVGQGAIRAMLPHGQGTLIFTGATASLRGRPFFAAFASAKAGLRMVAQAMAREFGPQGIHVAHVVIDGLVEGDRVRGVGGGLGRALLRAKGRQGALAPDEIAEAYWQLHCQHRSAWTHEMDLRPFKEKF